MSFHHLPTCCSLINLRVPEARKEVAMRRPLVRYIPVSSRSSNQYNSSASKPALLSDATEEFLLNVILFALISGTALFLALLADSFLQRLYAFHLLAKLGMLGISLITLSSFLSYVLIERNPPTKDKRLRWRNKEDLPKLKGNPRKRLLRPILVRYLLDLCITCTVGIFVGTLYGTPYMLASIPLTTLTLSSIRRLHIAMRPLGRNAQRAKRSGLSSAIVLLIASIVFYRLTSVALELSRYIAIPSTINTFASDVHRKIAAHVGGSEIQRVDPHDIIHAVSHGEDLEVDLIAPRGIRKGGDFTSGVFEGDQYRLESSPQVLMAVDTLRRTLSVVLSRTAGKQNIKIESFGYFFGTESGGSGRYYSGDSGVINNMSYYFVPSRQLKTMTLQPGISPQNAESIAFLRAYEIKKYLIETKYLKAARFFLIVDVGDGLSGSSSELVSRVIVPHALRDDYGNLSKFSRDLISLFQWLEDRGW
jgi:hypothetical protein